MLHRQMGQQQALKGDQLDVLIVLERGLMLRLLVRRLNVFCDGCVAAQQRTLEGDRLNVSLAQERETMLRLFVAFFAFHRNKNT
jgi:hypothetical protein